MGETARDVTVSLGKAMAGLYPSKADMQVVGQMAITIISTRTKAGLDADHNPFKPYSAKYQQVRLSKHLRVTPVDLVRTGQMIGGLTPNIEGDSVYIDFGSATDAIKGLTQTQGSSKKNIPQRDFYDLRNEAEIELISNQVLDGIQAAWGKK